MFKPPTPPTPQAPPPVPRIDEAMQRVRDRDQAVRRGAASTMLTGEGGLPNLGSVGKRSSLYNGGGTSGGVG
jgi:hypothetical protein